MENYIYDIIDDYIQNEINYIKRKEDCTSLSKYDCMDLLRLENMNSNEKMEMALKIVENDSLHERINELIHYYLYEEVK